MKCSLCQSHMIPFLRKNGYTIFSCNTCGFAQTDLHSNYGDFIKENYEKGYFMGEPRYSAYVNYKEDKSLILVNMRKFMGKIKKYKKFGKLLDIGCAMGFFVEMAQSEGFDAYGLDPSQYAVNEAKKILGNRIKEASLETADYAQKSFDVITMFDVFEHLGDPIGDLNKICGWLKDDGIIMIVTGNRQSVVAKIMKRRWTFYIPPQHLYFFDRKTMKIALKKTGLRDLEWSQIGKWLTLRYVFHLARTTGESVIAEFLYPYIDMFNIGSIPLYVPIRDNMIVIAGKVHDSV
jgi:SAM-dependent methyltransferase